MPLPLIPTSPIAIRQLRIWIVLALAVVLRVYFYGGFGLCDDPNNFHNCYNLFEWKGGFLKSALAHEKSGEAYRVGYSFPAAMLFGVFGISEFSYIGVFLSGSILSVLLIYLIGKEIGGRNLGLLAAFILAISPFDVAFSTVGASDFVINAYSLAAIYFFLKWNRSGRPGRLWLAVLFACFGYQTRMTAFYFLPVFPFLCAETNSPPSRAFRFYGALALGIGLTMIIDKLLSGDFLGYYHGMLDINALIKPNRFYFYHFPQILFTKSPFGIQLFGYYAYFFIAAVLVLALLKAIFNWKRIWIFVWFFSLLALWQWFPQSWSAGEGGLYAQTRIFRYLVCLTPPMALTLAWMFEELMRRTPLATLALGVFSLFSIYQSAEVSQPSHDGFKDKRLAARYLSALPKAKIYADDSIVNYLNGAVFRFERRDQLVSLSDKRENFKEIFDVVADGYVLTGGGQCLYYGPCTAYQTNLQGFVPPADWELVREFSGRITSYRKERLRIWQRRGLTGARL